MDCDNVKSTKKALRIAHKPVFINFFFFIMMKIKLHNLIYIK